MDWPIHGPERVLSLSLSFLLVLSIPQNPSGLPWIPGRIDGSCSHLRFLRRSCRPAACRRGCLLGLVRAACSAKIKERQQKIETETRTATTTYDHHYDYGYDYSYLLLLLILLLLLQLLLPVQHRSKLRLRSQAGLNYHGLQTEQCRELLAVLALKSNTACVHLCQSSKDPDESR